MRRYGNLWPLIVTYDNLYDAERKARKQKGTRHCVQQFEEDLEGNLRRIQQMLIDGTFTTSSYTTRKIYEPKERLIFILPFDPDRIVQHAVMNVVEPIWDKMFFEHSYACRPGKGIHLGVQTTMKFIRRNTYCLKCDVSKFYPSIRHDLAMDMVEHKIKDQKVLDIFWDVINSIEGDKNVPIGNYMSQWLGNLYLTNMDHRIKEELKIRDYIRYCDDFILFHDDHRYLFECAQYLSDYLCDELDMGFSKCELFNVKQGVDFLGYRMFPNRYILLRKNTSKRMKKKVKLLYYLIHHDKIPVEIARSSVASMMGWLKWANTHNLQVAMEIHKLKVEVDEYIRRHSPEST